MTSTVHAVIVSATSLRADRGGCLSVFGRARSEGHSHPEVEASLEVDGTFVELEIPHDLMRQVDQLRAMPSTSLLERFASLLGKRTWYDPFFFVRQQFGSQAANIAPIAHCAGDPVPPPESLIRFTKLRVTLIDVDWDNGQIKRRTESVVVQGNQTP